MKTKNLSRWVVVPSLWLVCALPLATAHAEAVEVLGVAPVSEDIALTRDRAIDDAKRKAVEQVAGSQVASEMITENFQLVQDRIYARASGFVRTYRIIEERKEGDVYKVRIEADVDAESLLGDIRKLFAVRPKVIVLVAEQNIGSEAPSYWWGSSGALAELSVLQMTLSGTWRPRGYHFVDPVALKGELRIEAQMRTPEISNEGARKIGFDVDADVAVVGRVLVNDAGPVIAGVKMHAYHAVGTLRVISIDTGEVLAVGDDTGVAAHIDPHLGGRLAIKALTRRLGDGLETALLKRWMSEVASSREIELVVRGVRSGTELRTLETFIKEHIRGVESVQTRRRRGRAAYLTVTVRARAQDFATDLEQIDFGEFGLNLGDVSRRKIEGTIDRVKE